MATSRAVARAVLCWLLLLVGTSAQAAASAPLHYRLDLRATRQSYFEVALQLREAPQDLVLVLPTWTPGYYQRMDYAEQVERFEVLDPHGQPLHWRREDNHWRIVNPAGAQLTVRYRVRAGRDFVASNWLDGHKGHVSPAGMFMHPQGRIAQPVELRLELPDGWEAATALPRDGNGGYRAEDFDQLYDSPILAGKLTRLAPFEVRGVPHEVVGVDMEAIDGALLVADLRKLVQQAVDLIGEVPYRRYTFLGIGPSRGGIEHLESTAVGLGGQGNRTAEGRLRLDSFLIHEYFHHFNAKRIRPIELGPFDYDHGSRSTGLWVAEGLTVYYEDVLLQRAKLIDQPQRLGNLSEHMRSYGNQRGRLHQSLAQSGAATWEDGPFGGDPNTTITYYEKGPVVGAMLDLAIRHATANRRSLDDVMRTLYREYYQRQRRGWTAQEFRAVCERIAGTGLGDLFAYVDTTAEPDYARYFGYAGLSVDLASTPEAGGWLGISFHPAAQDGDQMLVEAGSPAWNAGVRGNDRLLRIDGAVTTVGDALLRIKPVLADVSPGTPLTLVLADGHGGERRVMVALGTRLQRRFTLTPVAAPTPLQRAILRTW